jgi:hypothetical protein
VAVQWSIPGAGIAVSTGSAWGTSLTDNHSNWDTAYGWGNHASAGYLTTISGLNISLLTNDSGYITSSALANYFLKTSDDSDDISEGTTHYFVTSTEKTVLGNTSGTNTGDQDLSGYFKGK